MAITIHVVGPYDHAVRRGADVDRRRRLAGVAMLVAAAVVLMVTLLRIEVRPADTPASVGGSGPAAVGQPDVLPAGTTAQHYVVEQGDSLWSIARALAPHRDVRGYVAELERLNGGIDLQPGQLIALPG